jgi:hypothetical protein
MFDNTYWGAELCKAHQRRTNKKRGIKLPREDGIKIAGDPSCVRIVMTQAALGKNMQTDAAAFEAWALALRSWCGVVQVELDWDAPPSKSDHHFQRFLYRAHWFSQHFPWLRLAKPDAIADCRAVHGSELLINVRKSPGKAVSDKREAKLERELRAKPAFRAQFGLSKIGTQFPVGLFEKEVTRRGEHRVFPGGAGAIDMIGLDAARTALWIFELKAGENIRVGAISELLLYCWMLRDVLRRKFCFEPLPSADKDGVQPEEVRACKRIEARLIGHQFHPLFDRGGMLEILNLALGNDRFPIRFGTIHIENGADGAPGKFVETIGAQAF